MKPIVTNCKELEMQRVGRRTDEDLARLRQRVLTGAYVTHPTAIADAMLGKSFLEQMSEAPLH